MIPPNLQEHERDGLLPTSARFLFYELARAGSTARWRPAFDAPIRI